MATSRSRSASPTRVAAGSGGGDGEGGRGGWGGWGGSGGVIATPPFCSCPEPPSAVDRASHVTQRRNGPARARRDDLGGDGDGGLLGRPGPDVEPDRRHET